MLAHEVIYGRRILDGVFPCSSSWGLRGPRGVPYPVVIGPAAPQAPAGSVGYFGGKKWRAKSARSALTAGGGLAGGGGGAGGAVTSGPVGAGMRAGRG